MMAPNRFARGTPPNLPEIGGLIARHGLEHVCLGILRKNQANAQHAVNESLRPPSVPRLVLSILWSSFPRRNSWLKAGGLSEVGWGRERAASA